MFAGYILMLKVLPIAEDTRSQLFSHAMHVKEYVIQHLHNTTIQYVFINQLVYCYLTTWTQVSLFQLGCVVPP